jgi:hypothetical protein
MNRMGIGVAIGIAIGAAIGAATHHMAQWVGFGGAIGVVIAPPRLRPKASNRPPRGDSRAERQLRAVIQHRRGRLPADTHPVPPDRAAMLPERAVRLDAIDPKVLPHFFFSSAVQF